MEHPTNEQLIDNITTGAGTLGAKIVELGTSLAEADTRLQVAHLANFVQPIMETPNLTMQQVEKLPEPFGDITRHSELPAIAGVNGQRFSFAKARFELDMTVTSHTEHKIETGVESGIEAGASGGWGPVSAHVSMHVDVSHKDEQTRTTDMSARIHMELDMEREPIPEGLAKMIDQATEFSNTANQLRLQIAAAQVASVQQQIAQGVTVPTVAATPDPAPAEA